MWKSRFLSPPTCLKRDDSKPAAAPKEVSAIIRKESARDKAFDEMSQDGWMTEDAPGRRLLHMNIAMNIHTHVYLYHLQSEICKIAMALPKLRHDSSHSGEIPTFARWSLLAEPSSLAFSDVASAFLMVCLACVCELLSAGLLILLH